MDIAARTRVPRADESPAPRRRSRALYAAGARLILAILCLHAAASFAHAAVSDPAWSETTWITTALGDVTGMAWAPDGSGRLFLTRKSGQIRIVQAGPPPALLATPFATVSPVFTSSECGLIGIAFHPDFVSNGWVYVFVTVSSSEQQIVRYTAVGDVGIDETTIVPALPTRGANHDGGAVGFGRDGKLYWAIGDLGNGTGVNADLASLASKVARAEDDGTLPADNPFADGPGGAEDRIWARGFRNPFTFSFQPATGRLWVDVTGGAYEQVFAVAPGDHAGWILYENNQPAGFITPKIKYRTNGTDTRTITAGGAVRSAGVATYTTTAVHGFRQGEKLTISGVADPSFHGTPFVASTPTPTTFTVVQSGPDAASGGGTAVTQNQGGAITGGTFYDSTGAAQAYRQNYFYGDVNSGRVMRATVGPGTTVTTVDHFATDNVNSIDVAVGPDGALYYVGLQGTVKRAAFVSTEQGLVVTPAHVWWNEGAEARFAVRLAVAPAADVEVSVARAAGSADVSVASGTAVTFTPDDWAVPRAVTLAAAPDADAVADTAWLAVSAAGIPTEIVEAVVADVDAPAGGGLVPGRVPDGSTVPGAPLRVDRSPGDPSRLRLTWGESCTGTALDYAVHAGTIGSWYGHEPRACSTGGATETTIVPGAGSEYYLVVASDDAREGSYGTDSAGAERPPSSPACRPQQDTSGCP
jgi:glucose/arabinose dehydrogenase